MSNCSYLQQRVGHFHAVMGQRDPYTPVDLSLEARQLRARIFGEEAMEKMVALVGGNSAALMCQELIKKVCTKRQSVEPGDLDEIADACVDVLVTAEGTLCAAGIDDRPLIDAVCDSNDAKVGGGQDEHGKHRKPPGWQPPRIRELLIAQGWKP